MKKIIELLKYSSVGKWVRSQWEPLNDNYKELTWFGYIFFASLLLVLNAITILFWAFIYVWLIFITTVVFIGFNIFYALYALSIAKRESTYKDLMKSVVNNIWFTFRPEDPGFVRRPWR